MVGTADLGVQSSREKALDTEIWEWDQMVFIVLVDVGHGVASLLDVQGAREGHFSPRVSLALEPDQSLMSVRGLILTRMPCWSSHIAHAVMGA